MAGKKGAFNTAAFWIVTIFAVATAFGLFGVNVVGMLGDKLGGWFSTTLLAALGISGILMMYSKVQ